MPFAALALLLAADLILRAKLSPPQASAYGLFFDVAFIAFAVGSTIAGTLIVVRQRRNVIGWLLLAVPLWAAFAFLAGDYATYTLVTAPGSLPAGRAVAWIDRWAIVPTLSIPILLFLLFPDGRVPSRRWRPVLWLACAAPAATALLFALTPGRMTGAFAQLTTVRVINPIGIPRAGGVLPPLSVATGLASLLAAVLAGVSLVVRFRTRRGMSASRSNGWPSSGWPSWRSSGSPWPSRSSSGTLGTRPLRTPGATRCTPSCSPRSGSASRRPARWPS
jgi:hypothetical protein